MKLRWCAFAEPIPILPDTLRVSSTPTFCSVSPSPPPGSMPASSWNPSFQEWMTQHATPDTWEVAKRQLFVVSVDGAWMCRLGCPPSCAQGVSRARQNQDWKEKGVENMSGAGVSSLHHIILTRNFKGSKSCLAAHFEGIFLKIKRREDRTYFSSLFTWCVTFTYVDIWYTGLHLYLHSAHYKH